MSAEARRTLFLDITRLVARAGAGPLTGIDRVERAYLRALIERGGPHYLCSRTALGWLMIGGARSAEVLNWIDRPETLPATALAARLIGRARRTPALEGALRGIASARIRPDALEGWFAKVGAGSGRWLSVGHMNLNDPVLVAVRRAGLGAAVMIHDTIPLDHPEWSGKGAPARLAAAIAATTRHADLILTPSQSAASDLRRNLGGSAAQLLAVPLGVEMQKADVSLLPATFDPASANFVAIGTLEPRKNFGLLLDVWDSFLRDCPPATLPHLHLIGRPGWGCADLLARLQTFAAQSGPVFHHSALPDPGVAAMLDRARALLAPSRAEGFGLPPAEAALRGLPVLATDLAVTREILGDFPEYLGADDRQGWSAAILAHATSPLKKPALSLPDWTAHFNLVFNHF